MDKAGDAGSSLSEQERFWLEHLQRWKSSGQTAQAYAKAHGLSRCQIFQWARHLRRQGISLLEKDALLFRQVAVVEKLPVSEKGTKIDVGLFLSLSALVHLPNGVVVELSGISGLTHAGELLRQAARLP